MNMNLYIKKKRVIIPFALILMYTVIGFFILPVISKKLIVDGMNKALERTVSIEKIKINPYTLTVAVHNLSVKDKDNTPFLGAERIFVNGQVASIFTLSAVVKGISIEKPYVEITRNKDNSFNFSDLTAPDKKDTTTSNKDEKTGKIPRFTIKNIQISQGSIDFHDLAEGVNHSIDDLSFVVPSISSKARNRENQVEGDIRLSMNGSEFIIKIETMPFSQGRLSKIGLKTGNIDLLHYLSYFPIPADLVVKDADINVDVSLTFTKENDAAKIGLQGQINLLNTDIITSIEDQLIKVPAIGIEAETHDIFSKQLKIAACKISSPEIFLKRDQDGQLNLQKYFQKNKDERIHDDQTIKEKIDGPLFGAIIDLFQIENANVEFQDISETEPFKTTLSELNVKAFDIQVGKQVSGTLGVDFKTESDEFFNTHGSFDLVPFKYDGTLTLSKIQLNKYAPYYSRFLYFDVSDGLVNLDSDILIESEDDQLDLNVDVNVVSLVSLLLEDRQTKESMLSLPECKITQAGLRLSEKSIHTKGIELKDGRILLERMKDGRLNFSGPANNDQNLGVPSIDADKEKDKEPQNESTWKISLEDFGLNNFSIDLKDKMPIDPVTVSLSDINIGAKNLKTYGDTPGQVTADMTFNDQGRIRVNGNLMPGKPSGALDVVLDKLDIQSVQPYFTEAVKIMVTQGNLNGSGRVVFDMAAGEKPRLSFAGKTSVTEFVSLDKTSAKDFFKCGSFYLSDVDFSLFPLTLEIKDVSLTDFYSRIIVHENGTLNLTDVFSS